MTKSELERKQEEIRRTKELAKALPDGDLEEGTVIRYYKGFEEDGPVFTYTALKIGTAKWFTDGSYYTWDNLLYKIDQDNVYDPLSPGVIEVATEWDELV